MITKVTKFVSILFTIIWMTIIFTEYWRYNPNYSNAVKLFQYYDLLVIFIGLGTLGIWFINRKKSIQYINGFGIFSFMLFIDVIAVNRFTAKESGLDFTTQGIFTHIGHIIGVVICVFSIYLVIRVLGILITSLFSIKISKFDLPMIEVALGIIGITYLLFFLALIGLLNVYILAPISFILLTFYWKQSFEVLKESLWSPIKISNNLNAIGIFCFLFLVIFIVLNFGQILRPFPIGSDSLRLYVNLPNLLAQNGSLIDGFQPYNWSLFMSIGLVVFGRTDVVLALSFFGGLLSLFALYRLSRKWLNINYSVLVLVLFYSLPMISFLSYMDMKIDMGLMFFTLTTVLLYYNWIKPRDIEIKTTKALGIPSIKAFFKNHVPVIIKQNRVLVLIGLLSGFSFCIKLSFLFVIIALFCSIWFIKGNKLTFVASFFFCFAMTFILKLDAQPDLRQFHENVFLLQWSLFFMGSGIMIYLIMKQKEKLVELLKYSLVIGTFFMLPCLPWLGKNLSETGKFTISALFNGKKSSPTFELKKKNNDEVIIPGLYQMPEIIKEDIAPIKINKKGKKAKRKKRSKKERQERRKKNKEKRKKKRKEKKRKKKEREAQKQKEIKKQNRKSGVSEDLHRFMGYEALPIRYLSLPYDVFIKTNIPTFFIDIGFVLFLLFPILFLFPNGNHSERKSIISKVAFMVSSLLLLLISIPSAFLNQHNLTKVSAGLALLKANSASGILGQISDLTNSTLLKVYKPVNDWILSNSSNNNSITYTLLLTLFLIILWLVFIRIRRHTKLTQSIVLFLLMHFFLWWILSAGASWYGITLFSIPFIFLFKSLFTEEKDFNAIENQNTVSNSFLKKVIILSVSVIWVFLAFMQRTANYNPIDKERATRLYYSPILKYSMGEMNKKKLMDHHFPNIRNIVDIVNKDKNSLIYMVGSPSSYFIKNNDSRVLSDTFLDFFSRMVQQYKTKDQIIDKLKAEGFKYIIFDLKMSNYDTTPEKTLTKKFTQFLNTLYANPKVDWLATDRKIKLNSSGEEEFAVFPDKGPIVKFGNIAIFKIN